MVICDNVDPPMPETTATSLDVTAARVVNDCLGLKPHEGFLLVTDDQTAPDVAEAIISAARSIGNDAVHARVRTRATSGAEPPAPVAAAMAAADVCLCVTGRSMYHTNAKGRAQAAGTRGCFNAPPRLDTWTDGAMTADFLEIRATAVRLADRLRAGDRVRVTSPSGTDVTVSLGGREPRGWYSGIVREPGEISAFPGGEVSFPPLEGTSEGTIVLETVMTDLGQLTEPILITVRAGVAVDIEGGDDAQRLLSLIDGVEGARNIGELGIGLNSAARVTDEITETKKRLGTAHFALGDNAGGYGGVVECDLHLDGMVMDATVAIDGEIVVTDGTVLI